MKLKKNLRYKHMKEYHKLYKRWRLVQNLIALFASIGLIFACIEFEWLTSNGFFSHPYLITEGTYVSEHNPM